MPFLFLLVAAFCLTLLALLGLPWYVLVIIVLLGIITGLFVWISSIELFG